MLLTNLQLEEKTELALEISINEEKSNINEEKGVEIGENEAASFIFRHKDDHDLEFNINLCPLSQSEAAPGFAKKNFSFGRFFSHLFY